MKKADYTIRLVLRPSRLDPDRAAVQITLRLSDGRRMYFTAKSSVPTHIAKHFFDTTGRPWNPEKYDKRTYNVLRGLYTSVQESISTLLYVDCLPIEEVTREAVKKEFDENLAIWNKNHTGGEWQ